MIQLPCKTGKLLPSISTHNIYIIYIYIHTYKLLVNFIVENSNRFNISCMYAVFNKMPFFYPAHILHLLKCLTWIEFLLFKFPNRRFWNFYNFFFLYFFPRLNKFNISAIYKAIILIFFREFSYGIYLSTKS